MPGLAFSANSRVFGDFANYSIFPKCLQSIGCKMPNLFADLDFIKLMYMSISNIKDVTPFPKMQSRGDLTPFPLLVFSLGHSDLLLIVHNVLHKQPPPMRNACKRG